MMSSPVPEPLRIARRSLQDIPEIECIGDWVPREPNGYWSLGFCIRNQVSSDLIPEITGWHVLATSAYPLGPIYIVPDAKTGISGTFHHQRANTYDDKSLPWRSGSVCTGTQFRTYGRSVLTDEPWTASTRLHWYAERTIGWIAGNLDGTLVQPEHHFEKPDFKSTGEYNNHFAFNEDEDTFQIWSSSESRFGTVDLLDSDSGDSTLLAERFCDNRGDVVLTAPWIDRIRKSPRKRIRGLWFRVPDLPVEHPYSTPNSVNALASILQAQGIDFWGSLRALSPKIRTGKPLIILLGYPVKSLNRDDWSSIHWQVGMLPPLAQSSTPVKGFRPKSSHGKWRIDRRNSLKGENLIDWRPTANWTQAAITSRGSLPDALSQKDFLIIGLGSLGSAIADQLARAGVRRMTIVDSESLEIGNLTRHQLTMDSLYQSKALSMANRLNAISPNMSVEGRKQGFHGTDTSLDGFDVILDTTGSDEIAFALCDSELSSNAAVISVSMGYKAQRLYIYGHIGSQFPVDRFLNFVAPLAIEDNANHGGDDPPREDLGCFNPVFPARADDIQAFAASAVKEIERFLSTGAAEAMVTFTQLSEDGYFAGIQRCNHAS